MRHTRRQTRCRVNRPSGVCRIRWDESVHEGGHALVAFLLGLAVEKVVLTTGIGDSPYCRTQSRPWQDSPEKNAMVDAAGAAGERSRGRRAARPSPSDRKNFGRSLGAASEMPRYVDGVEDLLRSPLVAPLLENCARYLYERHGSTVPGADLLGALPIDDTQMDAAEEVLSRFEGTAS